MNCLLFAAVLLLSPNARAVEPGVPPAQAAPMQYLPLTAELLARWGYDADKVLALPQEKRLELQKDVTMLEIGRLRRIELLRRLKPDAWQQYLTADQLLTPEGMKLVDDYLVSQSSIPLAVPAQIKEFERADGAKLTPEDFARAQLIMDRMFDGVAAHGDKDMKGDWVVDAHVRNETLYDMTLTNPKTGFSFSVGQLFVDNRHPTEAPSWYGNVTWGKDSKPESWVDYRFKMSVGYVDLRSRWFANGPDPNVGRAFSLGSDLGVPQDKLNNISRYVTYDDPYKAHGIIVTSLLSEMGRAYNLFGPLDLSWTVGNLVKTMWIAPNAAFDETLGLRLRLADGLNLGVFGGVTQNLSPVGNHLLQEAMADQTMKAGLMVEQAPHASLALWGKVPGASDVYFSVSGTQRWNKDTTVHEAEASLMTTFLNHPLALRGVVSRESGPGIEFDRQKARVQLDYHLSDNAQAFLAYERDRIQYGNARVDSNAFMLGLQIQLGGSGSTLTMDHVFGGEYESKSPLRPHFQETLTRINHDVSSAVDVVDKANQIYRELRPEVDGAALEGRLNALSLSLSRLDPDTASHLFDELGKMSLSDAQKQALTNIWLRTVSEGSQYYSDLRGRLSASLGPNGNLGSELYWYQNQALAEMDRFLGGRGLTDSQRAQLSSYLDRVRQAVQDNPNLPPAAIQKLDADGAALIASFNNGTLTPAERARLNELLTGQAHRLGDVIGRFAQSGQLAQNADRILGKIDNWSDWFNKHKGEVRELIGLLTNEQVWDAAVIAAGRAELMQALNKYGKIDVPVLGHNFTLQLDASAAVAASGILNSRLSPLAPVKEGQVDAWLLREAGKSLGLDVKNPTDLQVANALFGYADSQIKAQLSAKLGPLIDKLGNNYNAADLANKILSSVPGPAADLLKQRYGVDLSGLIVPGLPADALKNLLLNRLPDEITKMLEQKYGAQMAAGIAQAVSWAGDLLRREINMTLIQLLLASEELDRLTVDHGEKISDLNLRMAMRSFEMLDARGKREARSKVRDIKETIVQEAGQDEAALADKFKAHGKASLQAIQLDPSWPAGLRIEVDEQAWMALCTLYGDGRLFDLIDRMKQKYAAKPRPQGFKIVFEFDKSQPYGTSIWREKGGVGIKLKLGPPKDARAAAFALKGLEDYVDEK
ncbi:MAG: hypothetical protein HY077_11615 [Elusimicrobia bacterium]|nr:hypothetical protein [Elusimicrobiota bacterium]